MPLEYYHSEKDIPPIAMMMTGHGHTFHNLIARFMGPTWGPSGADRTQVGPMLAP